MLPTRAPALVAPCTAQRFRPLPCSWLDPLFCIGLRGELHREHLRVSPKSTQSQRLLERFEKSVCVCVCVRAHNTVYEHSCPLMLAATCKLHIVVRHLCSLPHIYACASIQQRKWDLLLALMEFALSIDDADDIIHPACQCPTAQCSCRGNVRCFHSNISTCVNMYVHIYRYWSHEKSKGRSPKLMIALFRILWPKLLLNFFLAATKVSQSSSCSMCTEQ